MGGTQVQQQNTANSDMSTTGTASTTEEATTSPLPQDAQASEPTEARGTVDERTVTGIEEELAVTGEDAENITQTATEGTKEFYTISTKSGKVFYLVIDNSRSQDNVYFLTEVSERDLMNFTLSDTVTLPEVDTGVCRTGNRGTGADAGAGRGRAGNRGSADAGG